MKIYLKVPFSQKDQARKLGAKWDKNKKSWFVDAKKEISKFSLWLDENHNHSLNEPQTSTYTPSIPDVLLSPEELPWLTNDEIYKNLKTMGASYLSISN